MFFVGLVLAIYKEIAVIYKTLAKKSTREHTRGISKCSNGRPYKCLNHRIDPLSVDFFWKLANFGFLGLSERFSEPLAKVP